MVNKNIIQKQSLHFQYNGKADGFALQKEVSDWCKFTLIPEIEQQLELYALADDYITIDRLVIDASIDKKDWQQKIRSELIASLNKKLVNYKPVLKVEANKSETLSKKLDELILFYFEKGFLPWWGKALMQSDFTTMLHSWITEEIPQSRAADISLILQQIITKPVIERMINQLPPVLYFQFIKNIFKKEVKQIAEAETFFSEIVTGKISEAKQAVIIKSVNRFMLTMMITNAGSIDSPLLLRVFYEELKMHKEAATIIKPFPFETEQINTPMKIAWQKLLIKESNTAKKQNSQFVKTEAKPKYNKTIDKLKDQHIAKKRKEDLAAFVQEGIYIENAGAVIIAAFIPALFEKLKISKNQTIVNTDLAAMMIQYAVTGKKTMAEHELVLPKILCGINLELPVNTATKISVAQIKEAEEMLTAVIDYWSVIKNTSMAGLRESFLKRNGKLSLVDDTWLLQVEQKPFDMLLQQLPWSISMIKLPWMKSLLKTEWI